ncbi:hypothetical protein SK128_013496 [Halocaridina rubra]|uniref:Uncharacterized protein n=1 Tax=Halocaridina rubra TaxID=373956 RepID=A0AAN8XHD8_HALRR
MGGTGHEGPIGRSPAGTGPNHPLWCPATAATDWDYWMGSGLVRKGREIIIPEISRTSHDGIDGAHLSGFLMKRRYSNKPLSTDPNVVLNLTTAHISVTEAENKDLLDRAIPLNVTDPYNYAFPKSNFKLHSCR